MLNSIIQSYVLQNILSFDQVYLGYMESLRQPLLTDIILAITHIGDPVVLFIITALQLLLLWLRKKSVEVIVFALAMFGGAGVVWITKHLIARPRPLGIIAETGYSFPSGHALVASIFFPLILYIFKHKVPAGWKRKTFLSTGMLLMIIVVLSRPYIGVHYLSDAIAGLIIGLLISSFAILIIEGYHRKHDNI
jgi:undecaprenyl-diphosphatase